jgi:hypothetical protein
MSFFGSDCSSREEDPLIRNQNKIISYAAQEYSPAGLRIHNCGVVFEVRNPTLCK